MPRTDSTISWLVYILGFHPSQHFDRGDDLKRAASVPCSTWIFDCCAVIHSSSLVVYTRVVVFFNQAREPLQYLAIDGGKTMPRTDSTISWLVYILFYLDLRLLRGHSFKQSRCVYQGCGRLRASGTELSHFNISPSMVAKRCPGRTRRYLGWSIY
jgi:hypothetical protein